MGEIRSYQQRQRDKIRAGMVINKLLAHVKGEIEMSSTQVQAARILLNKTMPDIKAIEVELTGNINLKPVRRLTNDQLMAIAAGGLPEAMEGQCETVQEPLKLVADQ